MSAPPAGPAYKGPRRFGRRLSFLQYVRFLFTGFIVGVIAIGLRELLARALPADTPVFYSVSVIVAYTVGILLGFVLHSHYTFDMGARLGGVAMLLPFSAVALVGALATWLVSLIFRYGLGFDKLFGTFAASVAFGVGGLAASLLTYVLNAHIVFRGGRPDQDRTPDKPNDQE